MSDEEQRRSMDDVLSSIRRIMRPGNGGSAAPVEPKPEGAAAAGPAAAEVVPLPGPGAPVATGGGTAPAAGAPVPDEEDDEPLDLTEMMVAEPEPEPVAAMPDGTADDVLWPAAPSDEPAGDVGAADAWPGMPDPEPVADSPLSPPDWEPMPDDMDEAPGDADGAEAEIAARLGPEEEPEGDLPGAEPAETGTALAVADDGERALMIDEGALEDMIRRVVRAELVEGEIGRNISENVRRLIEAEVARALRDRD